MATAKKKPEYNGPQPRYNLMDKIRRTVGSQALLSKQTGISEWHISRIACGWLNPSVDQLNLIAEALEVKDPTELLQ